MNKVKIISICLLVTILFLGLVGFRVKQRKEEKEALSKLKPPTTPVAVIKPKRGKISETFSTTGVLVSQSEVQVIAKANGRLISLNVDEGSIVSAGQVIGEMDHAELDAQISQAQAQVRVANANLDLQVNGPLASQITQSTANVKQAEANLAQLKVSLIKAETNLKRNEALFKQEAVATQQKDEARSQVESVKKQIDAAQQQIVSANAALQILKDGTRKEQIESARGQTEQAKASIELLKAQIANYKIVSPINGIVTRKNMEIGSLASPSTPIVTVSKSVQPELEMNVPEKEILLIKVGQIVEVESSAFPDNIIEIKIREISPVVDAQTRLVKVKGIVNSNLPLKIGMMFDCKIVLKENENSLILPAEAIINNENGKLVYVTVQNKVEARKVSVGIETPTEVEVKSGLNQDESVIYRGNTFVKPGDKIQIQADVSSTGE